MERNYISAQCTRSISMHGNHTLEQACININFFTTISAIVMEMQVLPDSEKFNKTMRNELTSKDGTWNSWLHRNMERTDFPISTHAFVMPVRIEEIRKFVHYIQWGALLGIKIMISQWPGVSLFSPLHSTHNSRSCSNEKPRNLHLNPRCAHANEKHEW